MATVVLHSQTALRVQSTTPPPRPSSLTLSTPRSLTPIPNKHIPYCPPGPVPSLRPATPPQSPPQKTVDDRPTSLLHPPHDYQRLLRSPPVYGLDHDALAKALHHLAQQPLPDPATVFPWLHGLHPNNHVQLAFFAPRRKSLRRVPKGLRNITLIKADGILTRAKIKGSLAPEEVLCSHDGQGFLDCDPPEGFSVRNFHIQAAKIAQTSDIVVYGDDRTDHKILRSVAERAAAAQKKWRRDVESTGQSPETYHTFVLTSPFEDLEEAYPELVAVSSKGRPTGVVMDFLLQERSEMYTMSRASEIHAGVYQGPSPVSPASVKISDDDSSFDVLVECNDHADMPDTKLFSIKSKQLQARRNEDPICVAFPSSGSIIPSSWPRGEADGIIRMCQWIYNLTHTPQPVPCTPDQDGDIPMSDLSPRTKRVLFHCPDGYTEISLLSVAYLMFAEGLPLHEAWIKLHCDKRRNFFAYPSDVALLKSIQDRILEQSPASPSEKIEPPLWLAKLDGSLPSRVLSYMYLGNLTHANNPAMLQELGIKRILSVGEPVSWNPSQWESWGRENVMFVDRVQDNGIDELVTEMERCLEFIGKRSRATMIRDPANLS